MNIVNHLTSVPLTSSMSFLSEQTSSFSYTPISLTHATASLLTTASSSPPPLSFHPSISVHIDALSQSGPGLILFSKPMVFFLHVFSHVSIYSGYFSCGKAVVTIMDVLTTSQVVNHSSPFPGRHANKNIATVLHHLLHPWSVALFFFFFTNTETFILFLT